MSPFCKPTSRVDAITPFIRYADFTNARRDSVFEAFTPHFAACSQTTAKIFYGSHFNIYKNADT